MIVDDGVLAMAENVCMQECGEQVDLELWTSESQAHATRRAYRPALKSTRQTGARIHTSILLAHVRQLSDISGCFNKVVSSLCAITYPAPQVSSPPSSSAHDQMYSFDGWPVFELRWNVLGGHDNLVIRPRPTNAPRYTTWEGSSRIKIFGKTVQFRSTF